MILSVHSGSLCLHAALSTSATPLQQAPCSCRASFRAEHIHPSAKLTTLQFPLRPTDAVLAPLTNERDQLLGDRKAHALTLTYKLSVAEPGKHKPVLHMLNRCEFLSLGCKK